MNPEPSLKLEHIVSTLSSLLTSVLTCSPAGVGKLPPIWNVKISSNNNWANITWNHTFDADTEFVVEYSNSKHWDHGNVAEYLICCRSYFLLDFYFNFYNSVFVDDFRLTTLWWWFKKCSS